MGLGDLDDRADDYPAARARFEEAVALRRAAGDSWLLAHSLRSLGNLAQRQGDLAAAHRCYAEGLQLVWHLGSKRLIATALLDVAGLAQARGWPGLATRLFGAADHLLTAIGAIIDAAERPAYERDVAATRAQLDEPSFAAAWAEGQAMSLEQAVACALADAPAAA